MLEWLLQHDGTGFCKRRPHKSIWRTPINSVASMNIASKLSGRPVSYVFLSDLGWVVLDRCGRHFGLVLNFLRDGSVPLPEATRELEEVLKEAQYYRVQGLVEHCLSAMQVKCPLMWIPTLHCVCVYHANPVNIITQIDKLYFKTFLNYFHTWRTKRNVDTQCLRDWYFIS